MEPRLIIAIARQELMVNIRNKWMVIFALVFGVLVVSISYFGMMTEGFSGMQNFTRTSASLLNIVLYIIPLISLTMGTLGFTGDRGSMELLFSQPVSRGEVLLGKVIGIFLAMVFATLLGFAAAGGIVISEVGAGGLGSYASLIALTLILAFVFLSLSVALSVVSKRKSKAFGISLFVWFFFVLFYDLLALGGTLLMKGQAVNYFLFLSLFGNPVDLVRVASLITLENVTIFGASGAALLRFIGGPTWSLVLLVSALSVWAAAPLLASLFLLKRQDI